MPRVTADVAIARFPEYVVWGLKRKRTGRSVSLKARWIKWNKRNVLNLCTLVREFRKAPHCARRYDLLKCQCHKWKWKKRTEGTTHCWCYGSRYIEDDTHNGVEIENHEHGSNQVGQEPESKINRQLRWKRGFWRRRRLKLTRWRNK